MSQPQEEPKPRKARKDLEKAQEQQDAIARVYAMQKNWNKQKGQDTMSKVLELMNNYYNTVEEYRRKGMTPPEDLFFDYIDEFWNLTHPIEHEEPFTAEEE